jgi:S-adenosylmethionine synthetase
MSITSGYTEHSSQAADKKFIIFTGSSAQSYTLPDSSHCAGQEITLKNDSTAAVTITPFTSSQTIDGATSQSLASQYTKLTIVSIGPTWAIVA